MFKIRPGKPFDPTIASRIKILINSLHYNDLQKDPSEFSNGNTIVTYGSTLIIHPDYNRETIVSHCLMFKVLYYIKIIELHKLLVII